MNTAVSVMNWKETFAELVEDFMAWGCSFSRNKLPEIAMGYDCTPLFFWNWMDDSEMPKTEKGFLRVLGYAWRKIQQEEASVVLQPMNGAAVSDRMLDSKAA